MFRTRLPPSHFVDKDMHALAQQIVDGRPTPEQSRRMDHLAQRRAELRRQEAAAKREERAKRRR